MNTRTDVLRLMQCDSGSASCTHVYKDAVIMETFRGLLAPDPVPSILYEVTYQNLTRTL